MKITLLQRPGRISPEDFKSNLGEALVTLKGKLSASTRVLDLSRNGWALVDISGDDSEILVELASNAFGRAQTNFSEIENHGIYQGLVIGESEGNLEVDIGVENPRPIHVKVRPSSLRAQLADGKPISTREIAEHYCLIPNSKVTIRITNFQPDTGRIEGWLSDSQIELFSDWIRSRLDRVQAFDCFRQQIESAIRRARLEWDTIEVESMTLTTHSVLCKLGTDAVGLIPRLGSVLRRCELKPFIPNRILARCRQW